MRHCGENEKMISSEREERSMSLQKCKKSFQNNIQIVNILENNCTVNKMGHIFKGNRFETVTPSLF